MVDGGNEVGGVLGDVHIVVPLALQQFGLAVGQVRAQNGLDDAVVVALSNFSRPAVNSGKVQQVKMLRAPRIFSS